MALALLLSAEIYKYTENVAVSEDIKNQYRQFADELFGFVGGVAFLTLVINGPTSGPLLKTLGLVTPTDTRKNVVRNYEHHMVRRSLASHWLSPVAFLSLLLQLSVF